MPVHWKSSSPDVPRRNPHGIRSPELTIAQCRRSFSEHDHSKDKAREKGRRPTDGRSLNYHHTRKHAKDIEPHYSNSIRCTRFHDLPLNPWQATTHPGYARAASNFKLFTHLRDRKPNAWRRPHSVEELFKHTQRRRPTNDQSLNYHHSRKHAKDIEPHTLKALKNGRSPYTVKIENCLRMHNTPVQQWNASYQPEYKAANSLCRLFENIRESKLKTRIRYVKMKPTSSQTSSGEANSTKTGTDSHSSSTDGGTSPTHRS